MVDRITGNLFLSNCQVIINTVNTDGYMGAGIAKAFKERFPCNNKEYLEACRSKKLTTGKLLVTEEENVIIINFPTKKSYKHPSKMEYIEEGLEELVKLIEEKNYESIAMPLLGCGHGKLDEKKVIELIYKKLDRVNTKVLIFSPFKYYFPVDKHLAHSEYFSIIAMRYNNYSKPEIISTLKLENKDVKYFDEYIKAIHETIKINNTTLEILYKDLKLKDKNCASIALKYQKRS